MAQAIPLRIQRRRTAGWRMPPNTIYVGRPTRWGNPFVVAQDHAALEQYGDYTANVDLWGGWPVRDTQTAVRAFEEMKATHLPLAALRELRGKNLACWCPLDQPCHADVLLRLANEECE